MTLVPALNTRCTGYRHFRPRGLRELPLLTRDDFDQGEILTSPDTSTDSGVLSLWCFNIVGGEILTFPDTPTTQGLSLWCFNIVGDEMLSFPDTSTTQGLSLWCFNIVHSCARLTLWALGEGFNTLR